MRQKMSFLKNVFGSSDEEKPNNKMEWNLLTAMNQLDLIVSISEEKAVLIFKHSTRCSISRFALKQFENEFNLEEKIEPYFLDLLNYRDISNEIAFRFNVQHQSPQVLLIKNGVVVYDASHSDIVVEELKIYI
ncbi:MAG TPA: bacillithiol system redox-active protein YtxJ [Flavobacterium sp.]|uniref:bacillithiol system redox-active protein YtxJ n=1 Tax=Flavobacterium sp. TaxID=239 RepID=UPI002B4B5310|nr:bacillithiol system redox-active protein YtxJ [Flavobacterium sp.]HLO72952.1 bacillithiol system redox-active protein YtxJ [Flavobacterium sp.]